MIMKSSRTSLALSWLLTISAVPTTAHAQSFDLECAPIEENGEPKFGAQTIHYQIDRSSGRWCDRKCEKIETVARDAGATVTLKDSLFYGDRMLIEYHDDTGLLVDSFALGTEFERILKHACTKDAFGNLTPYLAEPVRQKGSFPIKGADLFDAPKAKMPSGMVGFEVTADSEGVLRDCTITLSSGNASLDTRTCALVMERLRVLPARDRAGHPVEGKFRNRIRWFGDDD
jgi:hypothetical protein